MCALPVLILCKHTLNHFRTKDRGVMGPRGQGNYKSKNTFPQQQKSISQGLPHSPHPRAPLCSHLELGLDRRVTLAWERFNVWWAVEFWETVLRFLGIWFWNSLRDCSEICSEMVLGLSETVLRFIHPSRCSINSRSPVRVSDFLFFWGTI